MYKYDYWLPYASAQMPLPKRVWSDRLCLLISRWIVFALDAEMAYDGGKLRVIFSVNQKVGQIARDRLLQGQRLINAHRSLSASCFLHPTNRAMRTTRPQKSPSQNAQPVADEVETLPACFSQRFVPIKPRTSLLSLSYC